MRAGSRIELHDRVIEQPYEHVEISATLDGIPITRGQLRALVEPDRQRLAYEDMQSHASRCENSLFPSVVAAGGLAAGAGGAIVWAEGSHGEVARDVAIGGAIAFVIGAATTYPGGGDECYAGRGVAERTGILDGALTWTPGPETSARDAELRAAVDAFNARR